MKIILFKIILRKIDFLFNINIIKFFLLNKKKNFFFKNIGSKKNRR